MGNTVVGGDLNGATFFGGGGNVPATPVLYLYGKLNDSLNLNAGGSLYYAGGSSPQVNYNGGGKHFTTLPNPIGYYTNPLISLSAQLSKLNASPATSFVNMRSSILRTPRRSTSGSGEPRSWPPTLT